ncbi:MAG: hypothetical protein PHV03_10895, partial [Desulfitobacteriaceae bacterium]|nr:hypothetical protein [Desulfitobacteriaceae bacterium]
MNRFDYTIKEKQDRCYDYIIGKRLVRLATMGPEGTTSSEAAKAFAQVIAEENMGHIEFVFRDSFDLALLELKKNVADFILLPNAYCLSHCIMARN